MPSHATPMLKTSCRRHGPLCTEACIWKHNMRVSVRRELNIRWPRLKTRVPGDAGVSLAWHTSIHPSPSLGTLRVETNVPRPSTPTCVATRSAPVSTHPVLTQHDRGANTHCANTVLRCDVRTRWTFCLVTQPCQHTQSPTKTRVFKTHRGVSRRSAPLPRQTIL